MQSSRWGGIVCGLILLVGAVGSAGASERGPGKSMGPGNSEADITVEFGEDCTGYAVTSTKDISFISTNAVGGAYDKDQFGGGTPSVEVAGEDVLKSIVVKSGETMVVANCGEGGGPVAIDPAELPECSDERDNDGDTAIDHRDDPECETPDDDDESDGDGGGGGPDCDADPTAPGCGPDCDADPTAPGCGPDCDANPEDPACGPDCDANPDDPACDPGPEVDPCTGGAGDPGLLTDDTLGQTLFGGGLDLDPLTEDPDADGAISGALHDAGTGTPLEPLTDEAACAVDLLISGGTSPLEP